MIVFSLIFKLLLSVWIFVKGLLGVQLKFGKVFCWNIKVFPGAEHASVVDEMIHDAVRRGKSLYIMTIDFSDAFGSIPHKLIKKNLRDLGFSNCFVKCMMSSYKRTSTRVVSNGRLSDKIILRKGVKQGCQMKPTLFNICLDSLVSKLDSLKDDIYH